MKLFNQLFNNQFNFFDRLSLLLFSILPISIIIGNAAININLLLIDLLFIIYCFKFRIWSWLRKNIFLYLMTLYIFLNLNSLYSYFFLFENQIDPFWANDSIKRSFTFIKFVLLVSASSILLKDRKILDLVHKSWFFIMIIIIVDIFFERLVGRNIIGNISPDGTRIVSFFKDELVVGGLVFCFGYASITYFMNNKEKSKYILPIMMIFLLVPLSIFITGEKSNFIKSILLFFSIIYFFKKNNYYLNYKVLLTSIFILIFCTLALSKNMRVKYYETYSRIVAPSKVLVSGENIYNIKYFAHYDIAIKIFRNYPIAGVGNKNFRVECFKERYRYRNNMMHFGCITHPHQIHFEILSEQGILGYILILYLIVSFTFKNLKRAIKNKNVYHLSNTVYLLIFFIPLLPGGGIFSTFNGILFWIIFSLTNLNYEKSKY